MVFMSTCASGFRIKEEVHIDTLKKRDQYQKRSSMRTIFKHSQKTWRTIPEHAYVLFQWHPVAMILLFGAPLPFTLPSQFKQYRADVFALTAQRLLEFLHGKGAMPGHLGQTVIPL